MSVQQMPNGKWRAVVTDGNGKRLSAAKVLGRDEASYPTEKLARRACIDAERFLEASYGTSTTMTVRDWHALWTGPDYRRPKESTDNLYERATRLFVEEFGDKQLSHVTRKIAKAWIRRDRRRWMLASLRAMFSEAVDAEYISANPFARLNLPGSKGNAKVDPPAEETVWELIEVARETTPPGFAAWFQFACWTGLRPGEIDALCWTDFAPGQDRVRVHRQYNSTSRRFTTPKNGGPPRWALVHPHAQEALRAAEPHRVADDGYAFLNSRNSYWTGSSRTNWWVDVREVVGYTGSLYLATRHFFGHYLYEVLGNKAEDVASQLGHEDQGDLVRKLYGHHNAPAALTRLEGSWGAVDRGEEQAG